MMPKRTPRDLEARLRDALDYWTTSNCDGQRAWEAALCLVRDAVAEETCQLLADFRIGGAP